MIQAAKPTNPHLHRGTLVRKPLNGVPPLDDVHERYARHFTDPPAELSVARCDDVAPVGSDALDKAVISVRARVRTGEAFEARVARNSE